MWEVIDVPCPEQCLELRGHTLNPPSVNITTDIWGSVPFIPRRKLGFRAVKVLPETAESKLQNPDSTPDPAAQSSHRLGGGVEDPAR